MDGSTLVEDARGRLTTLEPTAYVASPKESVCSRRVGKKTLIIDEQ